MHAAASRNARNSQNRDGGNEQDDRKRDGQSSRSREKQEVTPIELHRAIEDLAES